MAGGSTFLSPDSHRPCEATTPGKRCCSLYWPRKIDNLAGLLVWGHVMEALRGMSYRVAQQHSCTLALGSIAGSLQGKGGLLLHTRAAACRGDNNHSSQISLLIDLACRSGMPMWSSRRWCRRPSPRTCGCRRIACCVRWAARWRRTRPGWTSSQLRSTSGRTHPSGTRPPGSSGTTSCASLGP